MNSSILRPKDWPKKLAVSSRNLVSQQWITQNLKNKIIEWKSWSSKGTAWCLHWWKKIGRQDRQIKKKPNILNLRDNTMSPLSPKSLSMSMKMKNCERPFINWKSNSSNMSTNLIRSAFLTHHSTRPSNHPWSPLKLHGMTGSSQIVWSRKTKKFCNWENKPRTCRLRSITSTGNGRMKLKEWERLRN
jgi:hypothetical protein